MILVHAFLCSAVGEQPPLSLSPEAVLPFWRTAISMKGNPAILGGPASKRFGGRSSSIYVQQGSLVLFQDHISGGPKPYVDYTA
jgi:hypothetical protein